ncbi:MAG: DUF6867 family protein [Hyphomicrobiaceae bacterium]
MGLRTAIGSLWDLKLGGFLIVTCLLGGLAAWMTGRSLALTWRPYWHLVVYMALLALAVRFFRFALAGEELLSVPAYIVDTLVLVLVASLGYRLKRTMQMVTQYHWLYRRTGLLSWTERSRSD